LAATRPVPATDREVEFNTLQNTRRWVRAQHTISRANKSTPVNMATQAQSRPSVNGVMPRKPSAPRPVPTKRPNPNASRQLPNGVAKHASQKAAPVANKAHSVAGEMPANGVTSAYAIMASRIANRVAEMAESITFVERYSFSSPQAKRISNRTLSLDRSHMNKYPTNQTRKNAHANSK
jgi:hypothetical protein